MILVFHGGVYSFKAFKPTRSIHLLSFDVIFEIFDPYISIMNTVKSHKNASGGFL